MLTALVTLFVIAVVGLVAVGVVFALVAALFGLAFGAVAMLFKLLPLLLVGYVVFKLVQRSGDPRRRLTGADQRWLDS